MKQSCIIVCIWLTLGVSAEARADPGLDLAKSKMCMGCHTIDKKRVGPAYRDVAKKYAGQKIAEDRLTDKILMGGTGVWGANVMPANSQVSPSEARTLVRWILNMQPSIQD